MVYHSVPFEVKVPSKKCHKLPTDYCLGYRIINFTSISEKPLEYPFLSWTESWS